MENVYDVKLLSCTEAINWREYFDRFNETIGQDPAHAETPKTYQERLDAIAENARINFSEDELLQLDSDCSISLLDVDNEAPCHTPKQLLRMRKGDDNKLKNSAENTDLKTIKVKQEWLGVSKLGVRMSLIQNSIHGQNYSTDLNLEPGKNVVITVRVYKPFKYKRYDDFKRSLDNIFCLYEINILGSQTLQDLKDKITCPNSKLVYREVQNIEELKELRKNESAEEKYPSSFFFVTDTFFKDMRPANAVDTTTVIKEWANLNKIPEFQSCNMNEKQLIDIKFRLGFPYLYQHVADCEHLIVFSDIRLLSKSDSLSLSDYPHLSVVYRTIATKCCICFIQVAKVFIMNSNRIPENPGYFCDQCFVSYNYIDGEKIGSFQAYPYTQI